MFKKILVALAMVLGILAVVIHQRPADFVVTRSAVMSAPPAKIFPHINNFQAWEAWSPWAKLDPNAKNSIEGPVAGKGATMHWAGNHQVGEGNMTILESRPNELIRMQLNFIKPMAGTSLTEFTFKPQGKDQTLVTWTMSGQNNFIAKAMGLVMDCDKMIGGQFEKGLASIQSIVEK